MARDPDEKVSRIDRTRRETKIEPARPQPRRPKQRRPRTRGTPVARQRADGFKPSGALERFVQSIAKRVEKGVGFYHTLRLPGRGRVVQDRRNTPQDQSASTDDAQHNPQQQSASKAPAVPGKPRPNYFGDRQTILPQGTGEQSAGEAPKHDKPLAEFFRKIIERFEQGKVQTHEAPEGRQSLITKTAKQWMSFFTKFLHRSVKKEVTLKQLADHMVFRGLLKQKGSTQSGLLIGDLALINGHVEKFARFEVALAKVMQQMQGMEPGAPLAKQVIRDGVQADVVRYIAIGPPQADADMVLPQRDTAGIFGSLKLETDVAERLGIRRDRVPRDGGRGGSLFGDDEGELVEQGDRFVPWWRWDREERGGLRRWIVPVTFGTIVAVLVVAAWVLMRSA